MTAAEARAAAARIVGRVDRSGAYSNVVSRTETRGMNPSDAGVARGLAYDTLRSLPDIDAEIAHNSRRPIERIDAGLLDLLRVGVAEIARRDRPNALTVDAVVRAAKHLDRSFGGFANGMLRTIARTPPVLRPSMPEWLTDELSSAFDQSEIDAFWEASMISPELGIRGAGDPGDGYRPVALIPGSHLGSGPIPEGFTIQDPASVAVGLVVDAHPGELVLDMAAAPGGKTAQLVESGASVVACDVHRRRTRSAARRVPDASWVVADGRRPPFSEETFDAVLLDAPCTGLGTLRRRPEIMHRTGPEDVRHLSRLAAELLEAALRIVRPGGRVIYSVCTVTPSETIDVLVGHDARPPDLDLPGRAFGPGWLLAPHLGPTDGMFVAVIER
jgi:16S rRNA (cytosine967-C5)-methyltransferase